MAPEVLSCKFQNLKSDIWSLGITIFELLTGKYPFSGKSKAEIYGKIKTGKYQINSKLELSNNCIDFLSKCLQFNPSERWSALELLGHPFLQGRSTLLNKYEDVYE